MRRIVFAFWVAILFATNSAPVWAELSAAEKDAAFERQAAAIAATDDIVGLALAVVRDGQPVLVKTYGTRKLNGTEPVDPRTVFRVGSLSKAFATAVVAQLVAEGKLKLSTKATTYVPEFRLRDPSQLGAVTLEDVMSHRLGLPHNAYDNLLERNVSPSRILHRLNEVHMICRVGDCYAYQNIAFNMITDVIEAVDGRQIGEAIAARIFKPLGMKTASMGREGLRHTGNWARPHRRRKGQPWHVSYVTQTYYRLPAAAGVNASITDMIPWLAAQMGDAPDVLSPEMLSMLHKPRVETPKQVRRMNIVLGIDSAQYGLGWRIYEYRGETIVSHTGSVSGYAAQITFVPSRNAGIVLLTNSRSGIFYRLMPAWLNLELGPEGSVEAGSHPRPDSG